MFVYLDLPTESEWFGPTAEGWDMWVSEETISPDQMMVLQYPETHEAGFKATISFRFD